MSATRDEDGDKCGRRAVKNGPDVMLSITFAGIGAIDRAASLRGADGDVNYMYCDPCARIGAFAGDRVLWRARGSGGDSDTDAAGFSEQPLRYVTRDELMARATADGGADFARYPPSAADTQPPPLLVFLGLEPRATRFYFALDLLAVPGLATRDAVLASFHDARLVDLRTAAAAMYAGGAQFDAGLLAHARGVLDWNKRHGLCAACGARTVSRDAGYRRVCTSQLAAASPAARFQARASVPAAAAAGTTSLIHPAGDRLLLGRRPGSPCAMYTCPAAGTVEPGETLEAAARRVVHEQTRVDVGNVEYVLSQPWPMPPGSLVLGCMAQVEREWIAPPDDDGEFVDVRWVTADEVRGMIAASDARFMGGASGGAAGTGAAFVPPASSTAGNLIREWIARWAPPAGGGGVEGHARM
ncbi:NADH pyrophosphatase [Blastocladiella emersonii ATCC 22665]|nr:NADH pyrophosphatase [Blastocladiella emersonii ATCC 22665]